MLRIIVHLVRCAYEASDAGQVKPEWPPHPARLFGALVDAAELSNGEHRNVLQILEGTKPPLIRHGDAKTSDDPRANYVVTNSLNPESKYGSVLLRVATGQRTWPRTVVDNPDLTFEWTDLTLNRQELQALDQIAARVPYFGRSTSPAFVRVEQLTDPTEEATQTGDDLTQAVRSAAPTTWRPIADGVGVALRGTRPGYLDRLMRAYDSSMSAHEVPTVELEYTKDGEGSTAAMASAGYEPTLLIHRLGRPIDGRRLPEVTALVRRAFLHHLTSRLPANEQPAALCGHANLGEERWVQIMFLGLTNVGHEHADGTLKGVGLAMPLDLDRRWRTLAYEAWSKITELTFGSRGVGQLHSVVGTPMRALQSSRWANAARTWESCTPVVPARFCSSDTQRRRYIVEACVKVGLPEPDVEIQRLSSVAGALRLGHHHGVRRPGDIGRPSFHARITFPSDVQGPLVLGGMRHLGLGMFIPSPGPRP